MKKIMSKFLSILIVAAVVISTGFTNIEKPVIDPVGSIIIEAEVPGSGEADTCQEGDEDEAPYDDPLIRILQ